MRLLYRVRFRRDHRWAPDHISELLDGQLAPGARSRMERHLAECPECERLLAGVRSVVHGLGRLPTLAASGDGARIAALVRGRLDEPPAS